MKSAPCSAPPPSGPIASTETSPRATIGMARMRSQRPSTRTPRRLTFAISLTMLLAGAAGAGVSAGGEDGPMASAPLPPPRGAAPPATELQQPQPAPSSASRPALPRFHPRVESSTDVVPWHKRSSDPRHLNRVAHDAPDQKRFGQRAAGDSEHRKSYTVPQVAHATTTPPPPLPFPYGYFPGAAPAYGYALVYPPPWPPGPVWPH